MKTSNWPYEANHVEYTDGTICNCEHCAEKRGFVVDKDKYILVSQIKTEGLELHFNPIAIHDALKEDLEKKTQKVTGCPKPADVLRARTEFLGGDLQTR